MPSINVLFEGSVVAVPADGVTLISELVKRAADALGVSIRGLTVHRITRADGKALRRDPGHAAAKEELDNLDALDASAFALGEHIVLLERTPPSPPLAVAALRALAARGVGAGRAGADDAGPDAAPPAPPARSPSMSASELAGPAFEGEARVEICHVLRESCPWMSDHSALLSRHLHNGGHRRLADIFCCVTEASQAASVSVPLNGLRVLLPDAATGALPPAPAVAIPPAQALSPIDATCTGPLKYFVAEAYSGNSDRARLDKLYQLETLVHVIVARWNDGQGAALPAVNDPTAVVGTAGLVFSATSERRAAVLDAACNMVQDNAGAGVRRLIQAGRFFVMVLDRSQTPLTNMAREQQKQRHLIASIPEEVANLVLARLRQPQR